MFSKIEAKFVKMKNMHMNIAPSLKYLFKFQLRTDAGYNSSMHKMILVPNALLYHQRKEICL